MRVAFVSFEFPPKVYGGAGVYAASITGALGELGHKLTIFTQASNVEPESVSLPDSLNLVTVGKPEGPFPRALQFWLQLPFALRRAHRETPFDVLHFNGLSYWFAERRPVKDCPQVATIHHSVIDARHLTGATPSNFGARFRGENAPFLPMIEERCVHSVDSVIAVSRFTHDRLVKLHRLRPEKISVVHHGIWISNAEAAPTEVAALRARLALDQAPVVLFVGRIDDPRKGLSTLLEAFGRVKKTVHANLLVVGGGRTKQIEERIRLLELNKNVKLAGWVDERTLRACYALCDVLVSPSLLEGLGLVLLEAMAAGKPIVSTAVGGVGEIAGIAEAGIVVEPADIDGIARAIVRLLRDPVWGMKIGERNRAVAAKEFNWERAARLTESVYARVSSERARCRAAA